MRQAGLMLVGLVAVLVLRNVVGAQEAGSRRRPRTSRTRCSVSSRVMGAR